MANARTRRLRWSAPLLVAAVIAMIAAVPGLSAASPSLAPITPKDLIAKAQQSQVSAFSGTLTLSTNLGIPNLSGLSNASGGGRHSGGFNPIDLLSGSHQALVWVGGANTTRVALLQDLAETDVIRTGQSAWLWDSTTKKATHYTAAATSDAHAATPETPGTPEVIKTPQQEATDLLANLDPSTTVSVGPSVNVAHHKAYQLVLTPKAGVSTVDHVAIAVDSANGFPLEVKTFAKGLKSAAITLGFTKVSYSKPASSEFSFTPPPGATVANETVGGSKPAANGAGKSADAAATDQPTTVGDGWATVAIFRNVQIPKQFDQYLKTAKPVSGTFGTGRVLSTSLVTIIVLDDGRVAVGAVNVSTLEAAIASAH